MKRYLIDTCVAIWLFEENKRVDNVNYDMQYYQGEFFISMESVTELFYLIQSGKLKSKTSIETILNKFKSFNINILDFDLKALNVLKKLPFFKEHPDPVDRKIIAHAIANHSILISSDEKFLLYQPYRLKYVEV
jgi:PIN domain nuclease of toxin-antitoxin system